QGHVFDVFFHGFVPLNLPGEWLLDEANSPRAEIDAGRLSGQRTKCSFSGLLPSGLSLSARSRNLPWWSAHRLTGGGAARLVVFSSERRRTEFSRVSCSSLAGRPQASRQMFLRPPIPNLARYRMS